MYVWMDVWMYGCIYIYIYSIYIYTLIQREREIYIYIYSRGCAHRRAAQVAIVSHKLSPELTKLGDGSLG